MLSGRDAGSAPTLSAVSVGVGSATFDGISKVTLTLTANTAKSQGAAETLSGVYSLAAISIPSTPVPGVFIYGNNHAAAQNYPSYALNSPSASVGVGDILIVYFTGGGAVHGASSIMTGHATPNGLFPVTASYSATVGGVAASVAFAGLTPGYAGLYQANLTIPSVPAGQHPLVLTIGGVASNSTTISIK